MRVVAAVVVAGVAAVVVAGVAAVVVAGVAAVVVARVAAVVLRWRLLDALAGGPTAGPLSSVAKARRRRPVQVVITGVFQLDDRRASGR
jgi:hypothetical protein